jgi:hypothetical protein
MAIMDVSTLGYQSIPGLRPPGVKKTRSINRSIDLSSER